MNEDIEKSIKTFCSKLSEMYKYLEIEDKKKILEELEIKSGKVDFWNNQKIAKETIDKIKSIKIILDPFFKISNSLKFPLNEYLLVPLGPYLIPQEY